MLQKQQDKQITKSSLSMKPHSFLSGNVSLTRDAQKITKAIYLLTQVFPEKESIQFAIRQKAHQAFLHLSSREQTRKTIKQTLNLYSELILLLDIIHPLDYISSQNYQILLTKIEEHMENLSLSMKEFPYTRVNIEEFFSPQLNKEEKNFLQKEKKEQNILIQEKMNSLSEETSREKKGGRKDKRHREILEILKTKQKASINEVCSFFEDCSTKTIQRDLKELIQKKKVVKQGERRWATYRLA